MEKWIALLFFLLSLTLLNAEAAEKKYLKIGADPLWLERPLGSGEKFFSLDKDTVIVSKGKKKISRGWVRAGEIVAIKKNPDGRWKAVWIKKCGNQILNEFFLEEEIKEEEREVEVGKAKDTALAVPLTPFAPSAVPLHPCEELEVEIVEVFFINSIQTQVWGEFKSPKEKKEMKVVFEISLSPDFFSVVKTEWVKMSSSERGLYRIWGNFLRLKEGAGYHVRMVVLVDDLVCVSQTVSFSRPKLLYLGEESLPYYYAPSGRGYSGGYGGGSSYQRREYRRYERPAPSPRSVPAPTPHPSPPPMEGSAHPSPPPME